MDKQTREAKLMAKELPFKERAAHIWMYYKWWFISFFIAAALIGITVYQQVTKPVYDIEISLYSDQYVDQDAIEAMEEYISQYADDIDGNGEVSVKINAVSAGGMGENIEGQAAVQMKFIAELSSAMYFPYILEGSFYEMSQQEDYEGAFEELKPVSENAELSEILQGYDTSAFYWTTRVLYEREDEENAELYDEAIKIQNSIFGE